MRESANQRVSETVNQRVSGSTNLERSTAEQILDLLLDALLERQAARQAQGKPGLDVPSALKPTPAPPPVIEPSVPKPVAERPITEARQPSPSPLGPVPKLRREPRPGEEG